MTLKWVMWRLNHVEVVINYGTHNCNQFYHLFQDWIFTSGKMLYKWLC